MSSTKAFVMPAEGTPEFDQLKNRWLGKPVSFGQCNKIKQLFRDVLVSGGYQGKVGLKVAARLDYLHERDNEGRWLHVRTDTGDIANFWAGHLLIETLKGLVGEPVTVTRSPAPAKGHRKVATESVPRQNSVVVEDGQLIMVKTASGIETKRLQVNGNRVTVGRI